jgi:type IV pilus assembly protein PilC
MPTFVWEGRTRGGDNRKGQIDAETESIALQRLRAEQIQVTSVKKAGAKGFNISFGTGINEKELVVFTRQFATMIDAGLPLVQCLDILGQQAENKAFQKVLVDVKNHVEQGGTFSEALRRHPKVFDELYTNLVQAGEVGGILDTILGRLGNYIEKAMKLKSQVKGAMTYPISVLCIAIIVVVVLLTKVIPVFQNMFKEFKSGALPAPTQFVINRSESFKRHWYIFFGAAAAFGIGLSSTLKTEKGAEAVDKLLLKIPMIGGILRKVAVARFTRTLGTLLSSGVPILDALDITAKTAGNRVIKRGIQYAREKISEGKDMASPLTEAKVFPPMVVQMIGIGEQTGAMDTMLQKIADFYEEEVDVAVKALTDMIEPFMMVFLGVIVGGLIIAMYMPIFELAGNIKAQ